MSRTPSHVEECIKDYKYIFQSELLRGKVAFITGGGTGICFTIAEVFMRHQCDTVICSRRMDKLKESAETLSKATGRRCVPVQMDVREPESIIKAVEIALTEFGRIDYLINGAAGNFLSPITGLSFNAFKTVMEIDAHGTFNVSKVIYEKYMKDHGGVIVNITAMLHVRGTPLQAHAGSAKAAIEAMTKHMAVEWGMDGVRVMCVAPGPIEDTEGLRRLGGNVVHDDRVKGIPIQRFGKREDIGNTVLYVVSDAAQLVTGTVIIADGGSWLTSSNDYNYMKKIMQKKSVL
ncbi:peroxisomal 2,4-dienoyl-CoA reductase-like [Mizuhopecten yessoensis]|uniref:Peroxisomal 2,4-dienoyl-CoA reductase [(3E)-enoyl-CoA-producing] n=1 Tax=Mizuhopecten yessoensis TaxID=6573 RepID=A0A210QSX1_MIZYE|nr:peroxisomal 2,4-dienoyl-CoA reductase-like [Mizuhopecten yessoensis]OWF51834.1 Peroxisomal 2,4-dienoyl-CoA reductase [Mizuhopecten yessoensis]